MNVANSRAAQERMYELQNEAWALGDDWAWRKLGNPGMHGEAPPDEEKPEKPEEARV